MDAQDSSLAERTPSPLQRCTSDGELVCNFCGDQAPTAREVSHFALCSRLACLACVERLGACNACDQAHGGGCPFAEISAVADDLSIVQCDAGVAGVCVGGGTNTLLYHPEPGGTCSARICIECAQRVQECPLCTSASLPPHYVHGSQVSTLSLLAVRHIAGDDVPDETLNLCFQRDAALMQQHAERVAGQAGGKASGPAKNAPVDPPAAGSDPAPTDKDQWWRDR